MAKNQLVPAGSDLDAGSRVAAAIIGFIGHPPGSTQKRSREPGRAARRIANRAAAKAAVAAGTLALPVGPFGWITILPEMVTVWKIQAQMVADIAALYGKELALGEEQMLYCLFRHSAAQAVRDLIVRVGERMLIKRASMQVMQSIAQRIGVTLTKQVVSKGVSRWLPIVGAVGVGAYAYYDTAQVAATAMALFEREIEIAPELAIDA